MQQFINNWASGLIVAVIIATIIELILPENKNKKYVKMVSGIFILFTIISPIIIKFNGNINLDIEKYSNIFSTENMIEVQETASVITDKNIMKVYKENLIRNITTGIENLNYTVKSIELEIDENKNYGDIKKIYLQVENVALVPDIKIENVEVNVSNDNALNDNETRGASTKSNLKENDKSIIKEFLNKNYRISSSDIYIN